jgi:hypothetical protein
MLFWKHCKCFLLFVVESACLFLQSTNKEQSWLNLFLIYFHVIKGTLNSEKMQKYVFVCIRMGVSRPLTRRGQKVPFRHDPHQQHFQTGMQQDFQVTARHIQAVVSCMHLHYKYKLISCKNKEKNIFSLDLVLLHLNRFY